MQRGFAASDVNRLVAGWRYDGGFTPSEVSAHLETIRSRSRQMAKDSAHFKRWLSLIAINEVGEGFTLKATPHDGTRDKPRIDEAAARVIQWHWWRFCHYRDPETRLTWFDATGRKTEPEMDRLCAKTRARDGEYFLRIIKTDANPYGVAFRMLRPDLCDETYNSADTGRGTIIHCGVEMQTETRKPVAYWFHTVPTNPHAFNGRGQPLVRIPANEIIHGYRQDDEDQPRGIPEGHAALVKLWMLDEYDKAEITAARDEACTVRQYTSEKPQDIEAFKDLTDEGNADAANALQQSKEPGQSEVLPPGWSAQLLTPQHPNRELTAFKASMLKDVASGFGVEYSNFANDWSGVSFSSVRVGTISERDMWIVNQNDMIAQCKTPQFLAWLKSFLSLAVSGDLPAAKFDKFSEHEFRGRRWMWVDPMRDMNAAKMAVENRWKTNGQVASDMGTDYGDNCEEIAREQVQAAGDKRDAVPALNGAQITAALEIVQSYSVGGIGKDAAVALLTASGVPQDAAANMITKQKVEKPTP
jgi:lambda family phage portal protein